LQAIQWAVLVEREALRLPFRFTIVLQGLNGLCAAVASFAVVSPKNCLCTGASASINYIQVDQSLVAMFISGKNLALDCGCPLEMLAARVQHDEELAMFKLQIIICRGIQGCGWFRLGIE
jgi:hypothetical protein